MSKLEDDCVNKMEKSRLIIILIVENNALASMLKSILNDTGHDVRVFSNPMLCAVYREKQNGCVKNEPCADLLIADQDLPRMSGLDFFLLQRENGCMAQDSNKAILISSEDYLKQQDKISQTGCTVFKKPFTAKDIVHWVNERSVHILK